MPRMYYAEAVFSFGLQSGQWPDCNVDYSQATADLQAALAATAPWEFTYTDPRGYEVACTLTFVTAPLPCGDMAPDSLVSGLVSWLATAYPKPGQGWGLGQQLSGHLTGIPVVSGGLSFMVGLESLYAWESETNEPGPLWPQPSGVTAQDG
jgi:hypothetical protein